MAFFCTFLFFILVPTYCIVYEKTAQMATVILLDTYPKRYRFFYNIKLIYMTGMQSSYPGISIIHLPSSNDNGVFKQDYLSRWALKELKRLSASISAHLTSQWKSFSSRVKSLMCTHTRLIVDKLLLSWPQDAPL